MLSLEKFLFDKCFIEIMLKKLLWKVGYSELMCKSCARNFSDNIIVGVMLKSSDKFSKKSYTCKLYIIEKLC